VNFFGGLPKGHSMVELDTNQIHYKQCRVVGTHGSSALENRLALQMIDCGLIQAKSLITDTIEVEQLEDALQMNERNAKRLKCVVAFSD
jgi:L-iditol 2-dehydrogenase